MLLKITALVQNNIWRMNQWTGKMLYRTWADLLHPISLKDNQENWMIWISKAMSEKGALYILWVTETKIPWLAWSEARNWRAAKVEVMLIALLKIQTLELKEQTNITIWLSIIKFIIQIETHNNSWTLYDTNKAKPN